jgi:hypothetical protein
MTYLVINIVTTGLSKVNVDESLRSLELTVVSHGESLSQSDAGQLKAQSSEHPPPPKGLVCLYLLKRNVIMKFK